MTWRRWWFGTAMGLFAIRVVQGYAHADWANRADTMACACFFLLLAIYERLKERTP